MREDRGRYHISSAVVVARPAMQDAVVAVLRGMQNVEVHAWERGRIVIVIEGRSAGELGDRLTEISQLDGVVAANMVFEHIETEETTSNDERRTDAA